MLKDIFADFQEFLTSRGLADEKHAPFYARWISKFFASSEYREKLDFPQKKQKFLDSLLRTPGVEAWQKSQAETALKLYFEQFDKTAAKSSADSSLPLMADKADFTSISKMLSIAIRLKHY